MRISYKLWLLLLEQTLVKYVAADLRINWDNGQTE